MHPDRTRVKIGEAFHLAIHVHVRERVSALDELVVPDVGTLRILGDERAVKPGPAGTDVTETLTLEASAPGVYVLAPAYFDAIDARTKKPSRFSADRPVRVVVDDASLPASGPGALRTILVALLVAGAAIAAFAAGALIRRRKPRVPVQPEPAPFPAAAPPPVTGPRERVRATLQLVQTSPSSAALRALRTALVVAAGAPEGATLRDALAATADPALRAALLVSERAVFGPEMQRAGATAALCDAAEAWLA